jgi:hypothetical protein
MIPHFRFKNASTRRLFGQLAQDMNVQPYCLRKIAHISSRVSEADWKILCLDLLAMINTRMPKC